MTTGGTPILGNLHFDFEFSAENQLPTKWCMRNVIKHHWLLMNSDYNYQSLNSWCVFDCHRIIITMITTITTFYILLRLWEELPQQNSAPLKSTGIASSTQLCHQYRSNIAIKLRCSIVPSHPLSNWSGRVGGWDFVDIKFKSGGALQSYKQGSDQTLHSLQNPSLQPNLFQSIFLVVPSFWLYKIRSDSHKLTMSNPSMLARVYVPKNNFWIL